MTARHALLLLLPALAAGVLAAADEWRGQGETDGRAPGITAVKDGADGPCVRCTFAEGKGWSLAALRLAPPADARVVLLPVRAGDAASAGRTVAVSLRNGKDRRFLTPYPQAEKAWTVLRLELPVAADGERLLLVSPGKPGSAQVLDLGPVSYAAK